MRLASRLIAIKQVDIPSDTLPDTTSDHRLKKGGRGIGNALYISMEICYYRHVSLS
jgi:hypothetical protein